MLGVYPELAEGRKVRAPRTSAVVNATGREARDSATETYRLTPLCGVVRVKSCVKSARIGLVTVQW